MKVWKSITATVVASVLFIGVSDNDINAHSENNLFNSDVIIDAGKVHVVHLNEDKELWSWGRNSYGEVGHRMPFQSSKVVLEDGQPFEGVDKVIAGDNMTIALKSGKVFVWGANFNNQLGIGEPSWDNDTRYFTVRVHPTELKDLPPIKDIAHEGGRTMLLSAHGDVFAFGYNLDGGLGVGHNRNLMEPTEVKGVSNVTEINISRTHALAVNNSGQVYMWGNLNGNSNVPKIIEGTTNIKNVYAGNNFSFLVEDSGQLLGLGETSSNQLGVFNECVNESKIVKEPTELRHSAGDFDNVKGIKIINDVAYILNDDVLYSWGCGAEEMKNELLQMHDLTTNPELSLLLAVRHDGSVWAEGETRNGLFGNGQAIHESGPRGVTLNLEDDVRGSIGTAQWFMSRGNIYNALFYAEQAHNQNPLSQYVNDYIRLISINATSKAYKAFHTHDDLTAERYYRMVLGFDSIPLDIKNGAQINLAHVYYGRANWYYSMDSLYNAVHFVGQSILYGNTNLEASSLMKSAATQVLELANTYEEDGRTAEARAIYKLLKNTTGVPQEILDVI